MMTRLCLTSAAICMVCAPLGGCLNGYATFRGTKTTTVAHVAGSPLDVNTENGSITIIVAARGDVQIESRFAATTAERLAAASVEAVRKPDGTLSVHAVWPDGKAIGSEECAFTITLPDAKGLTLKTSNGSIKSGTTSGTMNAQTSNGSVSIQNHSGEATVHTSNGSVEFALADDSSGPVGIRTSNGAVTLEVGKAFTGALSASTSNGKISYEGFDTAASNNALQVGASTTPSKVKTSNGRVSIRRRN